MIRREPHRNTPKNQVESRWPLCESFSWPSSLVLLTILVIPLISPTAMCSDHGLEFKSHTGEISVKPEQS